MPALYTHIALQVRMAVLIRYTVQQAEADRGNLRVNDENKSKSCCHNILLHIKL